jgi:hypothetical protein
MILNNCTTCGRKPEIQVIDWFHHAQCKCGKHVSASGGNIWSAEVAADMWNRANPVEDGFEFRRDYINYLAAELVKYRLFVTVNGKGALMIKETRPSDKETAENIRGLIAECQYHKQDLIDFYKNRLQTEAKSI